jgi:hypothetical protein
VVKRLGRLGWLARYWVLDKHHDQLRLGACALAMLVTVVATLLVVLGTREPLQSGAPPAQAVINLWIQLAILVISALISYALRPKVEGAKPQEGSIPQVQDGKSIVRIYGTVWIDDSIILAWSTQIPPEPIKKKGGKK